MNSGKSQTCRRCLQDLRLAELRVWPSGRPVTCCDACMSPRSAAVLRLIGKHVGTHPASYSLTGRGQP
jgi:hypothetical protein